MKVMVKFFVIVFGLVVVIVSGSVGCDYDIVGFLIFV